MEHTTGHNHSEQTCGKTEEYTGRCLFEWYTTSNGIFECFRYKQRILKDHLVQLVLDEKEVPKMLKIKLKMMEDCPSFSKDMSVQDEKKAKRFWTYFKKTIWREINAREKLPYMFGQEQVGKLLMCDNNEIDGLYIPPDLVSPLMRWINHKDPIDEDNVEQLISVLEDKVDTLEEEKKLYIKQKNVLEKSIRRTDRKIDLIEELMKKQRQEYDDHVKKISDNYNKFIDTQLKRYDTQTRVWSMQINSLYEKNKRLKQRKQKIRDNEKLLYSYCSKLKQKYNKLKSSFMNTIITE